MNNSISLWPSKDMNFWRINSDDDKLTIKWSHKYFDDYKLLSYQFYECGYETFVDIISSGHDNIKSDTWFLTAIFLLRQSIELGLKALICRVSEKNKDIQNAFETYCHDVSNLFQHYNRSGKEKYLSEEENTWLNKYFLSLEEVDRKSDMFRFPFEDDFLSKYRDKFLNNVHVANNLLQAFCLVKKCLEKGVIAKEDIFDNKLRPEFFVFATHGMGNCYLWQRLSDEGFHVKVTGYISVIDFVYNNKKISKETKFYPLMFMFRNTIELCLKRLFYSRVEDGVPLKVFYSKRRSHLIKKDLWKNIKPVIVNYSNNTNDKEIIDIVEKLINDISILDKHGDKFRYPTSYGLEYRFDNITVDLKNVYEYFKSLVNFLDCCDFMLSAIAEQEAELEAEYRSEMRANMDWY